MLTHLIDVESGREQMLALTESGVRHHVERWTLNDVQEVLHPRSLQPFSGAEVVARREQRQAKAPSKAKAPTVSRPPGYPTST